MMQISNPQIIVGIDARPEATHVLDWAIREAALRRGTLVLVHAVGDEIVAHTDHLGEDLGAVIGQASSDGQRLLAAAAARVRMLNPTIPVQQVVSLESAATALHGTEPGACLVVVGSRSGQATSTLDHLESRLGAELTCPVVEVTAAAVRGDVLALADGTVWSAPILDAAFVEAALRGLPLTVVHVPDPEADTGLRGFLCSMLTQQVHDLQGCYPTVEVELVTDEQAVAQVLTTAPKAMACVVTDSDGLDDLPLVAVRLLVPSERPHAALGELESELTTGYAGGFDEFEREFAPELEPEVADDLESCWQLPAVEPPAHPALVKVRVRRNPLRRFGHEHRPLD